MRTKKTLFSLILVIVHILATQTILFAADAATSTAPASIFDGVVTNFPKDTEIVIEGTSEEEIAVGQATFATNWDQVLMGEEGPFASFKKMFTAAMTAKSIMAQTKNLVNIPSDIKAYLDLSVQENFNEVQTAVGQIQVFVEAADKFGSNFAKFGNDNATTINAESYSTNSVLGYVTAARMVFEYSLFMGCLTPAGGAPGTNYFGKPVYAQDFRNLLIDGLKITRAMFFCILKAKGYTAVKNKAIYDVVSMITDLDRKGILLPATALPLIGQSIDSILSDAVATRIIDITRPFVLITRKASDGTMKFISIDSASGALSSTNFTASSMVVPADVFSYSADSLFTFQLDGSTFVSYLSHVGSKKMVGQVASGTVALQTDKTKAQARVNALLGLFAAANNANYASGDGMEYNAPAPFITTLIAELAKPNMSDRYTALKSLALAVTPLPLDQFKAVCVLLRKIFEKATTDAPSATFVDNSISDIMSLLLQMRKKYNSYLTDAALIEMIGDKSPDNETDANHISKIIADGPNKIYTKIKMARAVVPYATRVQGIANRFAKLDSPADVASFMIDLEEVTSLTASSSGTSMTSASIQQKQLDLTRLGNIVQAFPENIDALKAVLKNLEFKPAFQTVSTADATYNTRRLAIIANLSASITVEEYLQDLKNFEAARSTSFTADEQALFMKKLDRIIDFRASAIDINSLAKDLIKLVNKVKFTQMQSSAAALDGRLSTLGIISVSGLFASKVDDIKSMQVTQSKLSDLFALIDELLAIKIEANMRDIDEITNFLQSNALLNNPAIFFDNSGNSGKKLTDAVQKFRQKVPFAERINNLNLFLQNNPKASITALSGNDLNSRFLNPFLEKLEWLIFEKDNASQNDMTNASKLLNFAVQNQLTSKLDVSVGSEAPPMFVNKKVSEAIELASSQLRWIPGGKLSVTNQLAAFSDRLNKLTPSDTDAAKVLVGVDIPRLLMQRIDFSSADIAAFKTFLEALSWNQAIKDMLFSISSPAPVQTDQSIKTIVANSFVPYLDKVFSFREVYDLIASFEANQPLSTDQQQAFISRAQKLFVMLDQATIDELSMAETFFKQAMYNYMRNSAAVLQPIVSKIIDTKNLKIASSTSLAIQDFSRLKANFLTDFKDINAQNFNLKKSPEDPKDRLSMLVDASKALADIKIYAKKQDLQDLLDFFNSTEFTSNEVVLYRNGATLFQQNIKKLAEPVTFLLNLEAMKNLIKLVVESSNSTSTENITPTDFRAALLKEKIAILYRSSADLYANKINIAADIFPILDSLQKLEKTNNSVLSEIVTMDNVYNSIDSLKDKIKAGYRNQELFSLTFANKITQISNMSTALNSVEAAANFYDYLSALVDKKVEAVGQDIDTVTKVINQILYKTNLVSLLNTAKNVGNSESLITDIITRLATPVTNVDRVNWLMDILDSTTLAPHHPDLIIKILGDFIRLAPDDASIKNQIMPLISLCKKAMFTIMSNQDVKMKSLIAALSDVADKASLAKVSTEIQDLQRQLDSLESYQLKDFLNQITAQVKNKLSLKDDDITQLTAMLTVLQSKGAFASQKTKVFDKNLTYAQAVEALLKDLKRVPTFLERFSNLQSFYNSTIVPGGTDVDKQLFMDKAQKTMDSKTDSAVRYEDDENFDKVYGLILLLQQAAYDKMQDQQTTLLQMAADLIRYRDAVKKKLSPMFITRVAYLKAMLDGISNEDGAKQFLQTCRDLAADSIQGTRLVLNDLSTWLQQTSPTPVLNNPFIYRAGLNNELAKIATDIIAFDKIPLSAKFAELQRMIKQYNEFIPALKADFYEKADQFVQDFSEATQSTNKPTSPTKDQIKEVVNFAKQTLFASTDNYSMNSLNKPVSSRRYHDAFDNLLTVLDGLNVASTAMFFEDRIADFRNQFDSRAMNSYDNKFGKLTAANVDLFVNILNSLIADKVDATKKDIEDLKIILSSEKLSTDENLYNKFGNYNYITTFLDNLNKPISYVERANNMKNFAQNNFFKTGVAPSLQAKKIFAQKVAILFEERWKAKDETFDLKTLKDLLYAVLVNKINKNSPDEAAIYTAVSQMVQDFLTPAIAPKKDAINYDFDVESQALKALFANLTDDTFAGFIAKIADVASKRVNAVYVQDSSSKTQAEELYDWLNSQQVKTNEIVFREQNQPQVEQASKALLLPITFQEAFKNIYNFVMDNTAFDSDKKRLFLRKLARIVKLKNLAVKENFDTTKLTDLMNFVKNNRFAYDQAAKTEIDSRADSFFSKQAESDTFDSLLAVIRRDYFGGTSGLSQNVVLSITPPRTAVAFVDLIEKMLSFKTDALKNELQEMQGYLNSPAVLYSPDIKLSDALVSKVTDLTAKFMEPVSFAEYAANLVSMLQGKNIFTVDVAARFTAKLKNLVDMRAEAYDSGYDLKKLSDWIKYALANQMKQDPTVSALNDQLMQKPVIKKSLANASENTYKSFAQRLKDQRDLFNQQTAKPGIVKWLAGLQKELIDQRVDGYYYNVTDAVDDKSLIQDLVNYLLKTVKPSKFVFKDNTNLKAQIDGYVTILNAAPVLSDFVTDFVNFANSISLVTSDLRKVLENKLARLIAQRQNLTSDQKQQVSDYITYLRANCFQTDSDGNFLNDLMDQLNSEPEATANIGIDLTAIKNAVESLEAASFGALNEKTTSTQIAFLLGDTGKIKTAVNALSSQATFKADITYQQYANRVKQYLNGMNANLSKAPGYTADLKAKFNSYMNQIAPLL